MKKNDSLHVEISIFKVEESLIVKKQSGILTRKPVKTDKKKPILKRWSVSLVLENIFISFVRV